jgi:hypothetical protein
MFRKVRERERGTVMTDDDGIKLYICYDQWY